MLYRPKSPLYNWTVQNADCRLTADQQQVVTLRVCASRWTEVCGGIGSQLTQQRKMAPLLKITIVLVIRSIFVECR